MSVCIVIAERQDIHADAVVDKLRHSAKIIRIDPSDSLPCLMFCSETSEVKFNDYSFHLEDISGVFCRFALEAQNFDSLNSPVEKFAAREHFESLVGILLGIPAAKWINFPWREAVAEGKIYPLMMAREAGLSVPPFMVSSLKIDLIDFERTMSPCIVKPISDMSIAKQNGAFVEVPDLDAFSAPYTNNFVLSELEMGEADETTPTLVQKKIEKIGEIRVVIIDDKIFASRLQVDIEGSVDSRLKNNRREIVFDVDENIAAKLRCLITDILGLRFAAIDLLQDADGLLHVVDINPSGNWLWQEMGLGLPISAEISDALVRPFKKAEDISLANNITQNLSATSLHQRQRQSRQYHRRNCHV